MTQATLTTTPAPTPVAGRETQGQVARSSILVAGGTLLSRVSGLVRVAVVSATLGRTAVADAYNLANTTPNIIYELLLGGVLSATLVPIFVQSRQRTEAGEDDDTPSVVFSVSLVAMAVLAALAVLSAPLLIRLYGLTLPGKGASARIDAAVPLAHLLLPQIVFYGMTTVMTAALNARRRFLAAAYAPVCNNLVVIGAFILLDRIIDGAPSVDALNTDLRALVLAGLGTTLGIAAMTVVLYPVVRGAGLDLHWQFAPNHPVVRRVARLSSWTLGYVVANQISLTVILALAWGQGDGRLTAWTVAFIFFQLPHGLLAVSIMTTSMPGLAEAAGARDLPRFRVRFVQSLRMMLAVMVPAAVGLALLARPLVAVVTGHGNYDVTAVRLTAEVLGAMAVGAPFFSTYLFAVRGFYAHGDTRTPFMLNAFENVVQVLGCLLLVGPLGVRGLAFAYSGAYALAAGVALVALSHRVEGFRWAGILVPAVKMVGAGAAMGASVFLARQALDQESSLTLLTICAVLGFVVYTLWAIAFQIEGYDVFLKRLTRPLSNRTNARRGSGGRKRR